MSVFVTSLLPHSATRGGRGGVQRREIPRLASLVERADAGAPRRHWHWHCGQTGVRGVPQGGEGAAPGGAHTAAGRGRPGPPGDPRPVPRVPGTPHRARIPPRRPPRARSRAGTDGAGPAGAAQEPYLEFNRDSWDKEFERAQIQVKFTEVLESLHPAALQERAAALVEHFAGELAEWEREHEALEQHHKQMVYVIRRAKEVLQQLEGDCREVSDPPDRCPPGHA